jgi:putative ABC transport system permease protein
LSGRGTACSNSGNGALPIHGRVMRAAFLLSRTELRHRWPSLIVLAVLVALTGGVTLTAVAGARRTSSSYRRFLEKSRNQDLIIFADDVRPADVAKLRAMPGVDAIGYGRQMTIVRPSGEFIGVGGALDDVIFHDVYRLRIVEGRPVRPGASDEVVIGEPLARASGLHVGQLLDLNSYTPAQARGLARDEDVGKPLGPRLALRVVGISRSPSDLSLQGSAGGLLLLTKSFVDKYGHAIGNFSGPHGAVLLVRLRDHAAGVRGFLGEARDVLGRRHFDVDPAALSNGGVQDSIDLLALSVLALGIITAVSGLIALALTISRQTSLIGVRQAPVRDLGLSRRSRTVAIGAPVLLAVMLGTSFAVLFAWVASPLLPFGVAGQAEPDPGVHFDALVLVLGALVLIVVVGAVVAVDSWRAARAPAEQLRALRPSALTRAMEAIGLAPAASIGVQMALEPRRGRAPVPVRSSLVGAGVAVLGLVAASVFGASLQHLHDTPAAFGRPWDVRVVDTRAVPERHGHVCGGANTRLQHDSDVAAIASACTESIELNGRAIGAFGITPVLDAVTPTVLRGRAPTASDEIALGTQTTDALRVHIGDRVTGRTRAGPAEYRVVGQVVVPALSDPQAVADGAVLTGAGLDRLTSPETNFGASDLLVRFRPGVDKTAAAARIRRMPGIGGFEEPGVTAVSVPLEVERLDQIHRMPIVLAAFLVVVGAIAAGHLLVTSVRRRRRDFAVLKSVGFTSRQVLAAVSWQATTVAVVGLLVGLVLGLVGGAVLWRAVAHQVGVLPTVEIPVGVLAGVGVATIVGVNVVAAIPARTAARTRPAVTLRSE